MTDTTDKKFSEKLSDAWKVVEKSRHPQRPYALDYIVKLFENFE
jgi:acetyl-CoA carboxylase alpha subunit